MDYNESWYSSIVKKSDEKIEVLLKFDKNNRYFTWRPIYSFDHIKLSSFWNEKCLRQKL